MDASNGVNESFVAGFAGISLLEPESSIMRGRRVSLVPIYIEPEYVKYPQAVMDGALISFQTTFASKLNFLFHSVFQQSADVGIPDQLAAVTKEMAALRNSVTNACAYIVAKEGYSERSRALVTMMCIDTLAASLWQKCNKLSLLMKSDAYGKALEYFKAKAAECIAVSAKSSLDDKVEALFTLLADVEKQQQALSAALKDEHVAVVEEVLCVYEHAVGFSTYTGRFFSLEVMANPTRHQTFEEIMQSLGSKPLLEEHEAQEAGKEDIKRLPYENYFLNGRWFATWGSYSHIVKHVYELQRVSAALYDIECSLQERMRLACLGIECHETYASDLKKDAQITDSLVARIDKVHKNLQMQIPTDAIYAGWKYTAGLLAQAKSVRKTVDTFEGMLRGSFGLQIKALHKVTRFLEHKCERDLSRLKELIGLYEVIRAVDDADSHADMENKAHIMLKRVLAKEVSSIVAFTAEEAAYAAMQDASWRFAPVAYQTYIMAGCIKYLYCGGTDEAFKARYFALKDGATTADGFRKCLEESKEFKELCQAFEEESDIGLLLL